MAIPISLVLFGIFVMVISMVIEGAHLDRNSFPKDFVFGAGSSAYQVEGAWNESGKGPSIWDTFTHEHPEKIVDRSNGDVAVDQYHRYKEDIALIKDTGMDAYRFSISWARVLPNGKLSGGVNCEGIQYYNNLIDRLILEGLQPYVTLFHWDVPQNLEEEYGGFLSPRIVQDFVDFADLCFQKFGDRVKHWITLNEPWSLSAQGYNDGIFAPGRCSAPFGDCSIGDSAKEPYIVTHNQLLAHAAAVKVYKGKYQAKQKGVIGITLLSHWFVPKYPGRQHEDAAKRALDFMLGWFMDPLFYGNYPGSMKSLVKDRLPKFSKEESAMVKGSYDFIAINYYTSYYVSDVPLIPEPPSLTTDARYIQTTEKNGIPIGPTDGSYWLHVYPEGIRELLLYMKRKYNSPIIYITENGVDEIINRTLPLEENLNDKLRIDYYLRHLAVLSEVIKEGVDVRGYFAWSLLDSFELATGYTIRFGMYYVDFNTLERLPKTSSKWFKTFLNKTPLLKIQSSVSVDDH